ncbi:GtrA family protein [Millisia brevis]|uniref:GtrA family protein n=1 Tax=Millisia brevis TaxID=264148 RepID=UPI0009FEDE1A|nr:GtrA family protein [Millisia brevis]
MTNTESAGPRPARESWSTRLWEGLGRLRRGGAFLVVGLLGFAIDAGTYNLLVFFGGRGPMFEQPLMAKIIAIVVATVGTYIGNRFWTYGDRPPPQNRMRQYVLYAVLNVVAIGLQLSCLAFSRYVLDLATPLADNISGTLIGQAVAVVFRYWAYGRFVFVDEGRTATDPDGDDASGAGRGDISGTEGDNDSKVGQRR